MIGSKLFIILGFLVIFLAVKCEADPWKIRGNVVPLLTPFTKEGNLNLCVIPDYLRNLAEAKISRVLVNGYSGEVSTLSFEERKSLIEAVVKTASSVGISVYVEVGYRQTYRETIETAEFAEKLGVSALFINPGLALLRETIQEVVEDAVGIAKAVPSLPIIYSADMDVLLGNVAVNVNITEVYRLLSRRLPKTFIGFKLEIDDAVQLPVDPKARNLTLCLVYSQTLTAAFQLGYGCNVSPLANIFPLLFEEIEQNARSKSSRAATDIQIQLNRLVVGVLRIVRASNFVSVFKVFMRYVNRIDLGPVRRPGRNISRYERKLLINLLKDLDLPIYYRR